MKRTKYKNRKLPHKVEEVFEATVIKPVAVTRKKRDPRGMYEPWWDEDAEDLMGKAGARLEDLCAYFNCESDTISKYMNQYPSFERAIKRAKAKCILSVAQSLFNKAVGMAIPDTQFFIYKGRVIPQTYMKYLPPSETAAKQYLSIVFREVWSETTNVNVNHSGSIKYEDIKEVDLSSLTKDQRDVLFQLHVKQMSKLQNN